MKIRMSNGTEVENVRLCAPNGIAPNNLLVIEVEGISPLEAGIKLTDLSAPDALSHVEVLNEKLSDDGKTSWEQDAAYEGYATIAGFSYNTAAQMLTVFAGR